MYKSKNFRYKDMVSKVLDDLVYHKDEASHPISKLSKIWDGTMGIQERIFEELRFGRSLEEAARYYVLLSIVHEYQFFS